MGIAAVTGLGNPGSEYADTRHNVGFMVVDELARRWRVSSFSRRHHALIARRSGGLAVWLVKPQTFMNLSGDAVRSFCAAEEIPFSQCLIVVDDIDLVLGQLRLKQCGGAGTHKGLRSLVERVGESFPRLRLGIRGERLDGDLADYVLAPFERGETGAVTNMIVRAADCVEMALRLGLPRAATQFNQGPESPPEG